jgi:hypothetical protein
MQDSQDLSETESSPAETSASSSSEPTLKAETEATVVAFEGSTSQKAVESAEPEAIAPEAIIEPAAPASVGADSAVIAAHEASIAAPVESPQVDGASPQASDASAEIRLPGKVPAVEPEPVSLIPFVSPIGQSTRPRAAPRFSSDRRLQVGAAAACFALVCAVAGAATFTQATKSQHEAQSLAEAVSAISARIDALDAARPHQEEAEIHKAVAEARGGLATTRDLTATIAQMTARLDRLEHEQDARLEKLSERVDHDATTRGAEVQARNADLASRVEKLEKSDVASRVDKIEKADLASRIDKVEKKIATQTAAITPTPPPKETTTIAASSASPSVSNEITGSIERPHPTAPIRGWILTEMRNGSAIVENRQGMHEIALGDVLPGAGKVEKFEKRGREWVVVTDEGVIVQASAGAYAPRVVARPPMYGGPYGGYGPGGPGGYGGYGED